MQIISGIFIASTIVNDVSYETDFEMISINNLKIELGGKNYDASNEK